MQPRGLFFFFFFKKSPLFIYSLIKIPVEHLIHANAEIKDVNIKTICLTEGSTFVKTFVNTPQEHKEKSECWCVLYRGSKREGGSIVCPQRHSCQGLGIHATPQETGCGGTQSHPESHVPVTVLEGRIHVFVLATAQIQDCRSREPSAAASCQSGAPPLSRELERLRRGDGRHA